MTLIIGAINPTIAVLSSDRLTTKFISGKFAGAYDSQSNKICILQCLDGIIAFGYTGDAYVGKLWTDNYLIKVAFPEISIVDENNRHDLNGFHNVVLKSVNQVIMRLRKSIAQRNISLLAVGWRFYRQRYIPLCVEIHGQNKDFQWKHLSMRPWWKLPAFLDKWPTLVRTVGVRVNSSRLYSELKTASMRSGEALLSSMISAISEISAQFETVGKDTMSVVLHSPLRPAVDVVSVTHAGRYELDSKSRQRFMSFTPWIVTPSGFVAPKEETAGISGDFEQFEMDGYMYRIHHYHSQQNTASDEFYARPQARQARPR